MKLVNPGLIYLTLSDSVQKPAKRPANWTIFTSPSLDHIDGIVIRTQWDKIALAKDLFDLSYIDEAYALILDAGKKPSLFVNAGLATPQWVYDSGAETFQVTVESVGKTNIGLPWDPIWQREWKTVMKTVAARYPDLAYVIMGGPGRREESVFVTATEDIDTFHAHGGLPKWIEGVQWLIDAYAKLFKCPIVLATEAPEPTDDGAAALQTVIDYGKSKHPFKFFRKSDGLQSPNGPANSSVGASSDAFRFALAQHDPLRFAASLIRGLTLPPKTPIFIEAYGSDLEDPANWPAMDAASEAMLK